MCCFNAYVHCNPSICYSSIENLSFAININTFFFREFIILMFFCHFLLRCLNFILYYVCILSVMCYNVLKCFWSTNWPIGQSMTDMTAIDRSNWKNIGLDHTNDRSCLVGHGPVRLVIVHSIGRSKLLKITAPSRRYNIPSIRGKGNKSERVCIFNKQQ